jgi:alpha/beta superfamily hydrolase
MPPTNTIGPVDGGATRSERLQTVDGVRLDARIEGPTDPTRMVVWCHPHPLMGGSMSAPLMETVAKRLVAEDLGVLRFDFRGVGASSGSHGHGLAEVNDVAAAVERAHQLSPHVTVAGWSFGGAVALRHASSAPGSGPCVAVAPALDESDAFPDLDGSTVTLVIGTRDQVVDNRRIERLAVSIGAAVVRLETDHLFIGRGASVAGIITGHSPDS